MEKNQTKKGKIIGMIVGVVAFVTSYLVVQKCVFTPPSIDKQLVEVADELNKMLPMTIDSQTRLDVAVPLPDKVFQYNYTLIHLHKDSINIPEMTEYLNERILNNIKTSPDMAAFRENEVIMEYNYHDRQGTHILKLRFTPEQYKK